MSSLKTVKFVDGSTQFFHILLLLIEFGAVEVPFFETLSRSFIQVLIPVRKVCQVFFDLSHR